MVIAGFAVLAFVLFVIEMLKHGLTNRAAARGRLLSGGGGSAVRNVRSRSSSVCRSNPSLPLLRSLRFLRSWLCLARASKRLRNRHRF